jgi:hypothetical protein
MIHTSQYGLLSSHLRSTRYNSHPTTHQRSPTDLIGECALSQSYPSVLHLCMYGNLAMAPGRRYRCSEVHTSHPLVPDVMSGRIFILNLHPNVKIVSSEPGAWWKNVGAANGAFSGTRSVYAWETQNGMFIKYTLDVPG